MRKLFALSFIIAMLLSPMAYASDVLVVLRNQSGTRINAASVSSSAESFVSSSNLTLRKTYSSLSEAGNNTFMLVHSDTQTEEELLEELRKRPDVKAVSRNRKFRLMASREPNDPEYYRQWGPKILNLPEVWESYTGTDDVYVAVIDSGIDPNHEDLRKNLSREYSRSFVGYAKTPDKLDASNYTDHDGHGTHCAGIIAGIGNNGKGISGVNWQAKIIAVKIFPDEGNNADGADILAGVDYVVKLLTDYPDLKIAAVNFSLGGYDFLAPDEVQEDDVMWLAFKALSDFNRAVICVAAGNETTEVGAPATMDSYYDGKAEYYANQYIYPASYRNIDNMIPVAASTNANTPAYFTSYSRKYVHVAAPGYQIFSTVPGYVSQDKTIGSYAPYPYDSFSGTSMATPQVSGACALLKSIFPDATASEIKSAILGGADGNYLRDDGTSMYGLLDVKGAVEFMKRNRLSESAPLIADVNLPLSVVNQSYNFEFAASGTQPITFSIDGDLPEGLTLRNGILKGTPTIEGVYDFVLTAENDYGSDSLSLTLNVDAGTAPVIGDAISLPDMYVKTKYKFPLRIETGTWPVSWDFLSDNFPDDSVLEFDEFEGRLTLIPTKAGTYELVLKATNYAGSDTKTLTINVLESKIPVFESKTLRDGIKGMTYGLSDSDDIKSQMNKKNVKGEHIEVLGTMPVKIRLTEGKLPDGMEYTVKSNPPDIESCDIYISGTPTETGTFTFTFNASNEFGMVSKDYTITISGSKPEFVTEQDTILTMRWGAYSETSEVVVSGTSPMTIIISEGRLPNGTELKVGTNTAFIAGTPTETGTFPIVIKAVNEEGEATLSVISYSGEGINLLDRKLPDAVKGESYSYTLKTLNNIAGTFGLVSPDGKGQYFPEGLTLSETGTISGIPNETGKFTFRVQGETESYTTTTPLILMVHQKPAIENDSLPDGEVNTSYNAHLNSSGTGSIRWIATGSLPEGLTLASNGYIFGTPTSAGKYTFTIHAVSESGSSNKEFTVNITSSSSPDPEPEPEPEKNIIQGDTRDVSSLTSSELSVIQSDGERIVAVLPELEVRSSGYYSFESADCFRNINVSSDIPAGYSLVWHPFVDDESELYDDDSYAIFYDQDMNEITNINGNISSLNLGAWLNAGHVYRPVITAKKEEGNNNNNPGSAGGGCNVSSCIAIAFALLIFKKHS